MQETLRRPKKLCPWGADDPLDKESLSILYLLSSILSERERERERDFKELAHAIIEEWGVQNQRWEASRLETRGVSTV